MLGKLLKHEWRAVSKVLGIVNLTIVLITMIGCFILNTDIFDQPGAAPLAVFLVILYALSLMVFSTVTIIYVYVRFYKNLYTAEGYLMHTLPVMPLQLFHSKFLIGYFWVTLNSLLTMISIMALGFSAGYHTARTGDSENIDEILQELGILVTANETAAQDFSFQSIFGFTPVQFIFLLLLMQLFSAFASVMIGYVSILLGQLVEKYKLAAAIGFYIALYMVTQIITSIVLILPSITSLISDTEDTASAMILSDYYRSLFSSTTITQLVLGFIFYLVSILLIKRKVNLD